MTQMLLFDSPASVADSTLIPAGETNLASHPLSGDVVAEPNVASQLEHEGGFNHMGDLARLVLLRYDLMAKRRAQIAARRRAR